MDDIETRFDRARELDARGANQEAQDAYFAVLELDPQHFGALNNLGNLFIRMGFQAAAHAAYEEAVKWHPDHPAGRVNLGNAFLDIDDVDSARVQYEHALRLDPQCAEAHQGLNYVFTRLGDDVTAERHRKLGFHDRWLVRMPYRGRTAPIEVLLLVSSIGGNVYTNAILDDRVFLVTKLFMEAYDPALTLPPHELVFNAIGDADRCADGLRNASALLARTDRRVINDPAAVADTGRVRNAERLGAIPGVIAPRTRLLPRASFENGDLVYPFLLRSPGHHTGAHFFRITDSSELADALIKLPGRELLAIEFIDARDRDGKIRKYRVMIIGGELYPLHLAIATHWMVHYYNAEMADYPQHRAEEARFLESMPEALGPQAMRALEAIRDELRLDYGGIDFALDRDGNVLLFEANATMTVPNPPIGQIWEYRRASIERIFAATRKLLTS